MRKNNSKPEDNLIIWAFIIGVPVFLLMVHPVIFFLVFIPIVTIALARFIRWLKK